MVTTQDRPDLDGLLVKSPAYGADQVYLVDEGKRRWVPSHTVMQALFRPGAPLIADIDAIFISEGDALSEGAHLAQDMSDKKVYLVEKGTKRWVTSAAAMNRYSFSYEKVDPTSHETLAGLRDGPPIKGPNEADVT